MSGNAYIITGGAGFIGSNLIASLYKKNKDSKILVIDNFSSGSFLNITEACKRNDLIFDGEVISEGIESVNWRNLLSSFRPTAVFHLAAITDTTVSKQQDMLKINSDSFYSLVYECTKSMLPLVYASSAATYGSIESKKPFTEDMAGFPSNIYGFSKWNMERIHNRIASEEKKSPPIVGLRYFNVFGPGEARKGHMASMIYRLTKHLLTEHTPPVLFKDGEQSRDHVYVDDVVDCTIMASSKSVKPGVYNVGFGKPTSFNKIMSLIRGILLIPEDKMPTNYIDMPEDIKKFYQSYTCADMSKTKDGLGFEPQCNPEKYIKQYARWIAEGYRHQNQ